MNKIYCLLFGLVLASAVCGQDIIGIVNESASGTTSSTIYIDQGSGGIVQLTDIGTKVDSGNTSATLSIQTGKARYAVTSATAATGTALWFDASNAGVSIGDYILHDDASAGTLTIYRLSAVATTSATTMSTLPVLATADNVWTLRAAVTRPAFDSATSGTIATIGTMNLPGREPSVLILQGNTTACRLSVSGIRIK